MKHDQLCAIAHNLVDSMASGLCFVIGLYTVDVFADAGNSEGGVITVDFLGGTIPQGKASPALLGAAQAFARELPEFCRRQGGSAEDFAELSASFSARDRFVTIAVTDRNGRRSVIDYAGSPLTRPRVLDPLGRIRRTRSRKTFA